MVVGRNHRDPAEPPHVAKLEHRAVIQRPPSADVGIALVLWRTDPQAAGHAQVDDQLAPVVELDQQVLASPTYSVDARPDRVPGASELGRGVAAGVDDPPSGHQRLEPGSYR